MDEEGDSDATRAAGPPPLELVQSYAAFALRAIRKRLSLTILIFVGIAGIALGLLAVWPRSYQCEMKLMVQTNPQLIKEELQEPLAGAANLILRHENLKTIVQRVELVKNWDLQRPPLLRLKDRLREKLRGKPHDAVLEETLVNTLAGALSVEVESRSLTIGIRWPNPQMAARIVEAAKETFLESRHLTEIAAIQEKMAIWDGHATNVRIEINRIAEQLQRLRETQIAKAHKTVEELTATPASTAPLTGAAPVRRTIPVATVTEPTPDLQLPVLKEELQTKKQRLSELEGEHNQRVREAQAKIVALKTDLTPEHPLVLQAQRVLEMTSAPSSELSSLRSEVKSLTESIKSREDAGRTHAANTASVLAGTAASAPARAARAAPSTPELLPSRVLELLESGAGIDPTVGSQLSSAVNKYTGLRDNIASARVDLDTAQAAFNHRYKVVVPTEVPASPIKPAVPKVAAMALLVALGLALLVPILLELKRGLIVERWQVHQLQLPLLAEVQLPPEIGTRGRDS